MSVDPEKENIDHETPKDAAADLKYYLLRTGPNEYWYHTHCSWAYHIKGTQTCEVCKERGGTPPASRPGKVQTPSQTEAIVPTCISAMVL